ncbi:DNA-binding protein [Streptomyces sp. ISL-96]|uniref:DNA-binding protein n=1 Tax=Streptomyces sp. ISL-96 TaxID=2819191 RepID=UPI001BE64739|nr:DNA-binding protein [Streptomyces sp. ISL-96]MBT2490677.1 DNA-binding protein [Streptomyces sp. ISL-96]
MTQQPTAAVQGMTTRDLLDLPPTTDLETAGRAFGIGRTTAYALARSDEFPCRVIRTGRLFRVVTADMLRVLQVPLPESAAAPAA